jgi:hypothetical protein
MDLRERKGGGELRERGKRQINGNSPGAIGSGWARTWGLDRCYRRALLLHACAETHPDEPPQGARRDGFAAQGSSSSRHERLTSAARRPSGGAVRQPQSGLREACDSKQEATEVCASTADGENNRIGGAVIKSTQLQTRALLMMIEEEDDPVQRRSIIITLQSLAAKDDALVIRALCERLLRKHESIPTRHVVLRAMKQVASRGNNEVVDALLECVQVDKCFEVRKAAFALLAEVAPFEDERVMSLALGELRKKDLRGEPLFKPYGDPLALTKEAIHVLASIAPRGSQEVWSLIIRRIVDDSVVGVRLAAVEALGAIADGDMMADGGGRATVQALAIIMLDEEDIDSDRLRKASVSAFKALMYPEGPDGRAAGDKFWL